MICWLIEIQPSDYLLCLLIEDWRKTTALKWKRRKMTCRIDPRAIEGNIVNDITGKRGEEPKAGIIYPLMKTVKTPKQM
jgi:hypothetical protein